MWGVKTKVIPVVVGALGSIPLRLNDNLRAIEVGIPVGLIQRCALLGSPVGHAAHVILQILCFVSVGLHCFLFKYLELVQ